MTLLLAILTGSCRDAEVALAPGDLPQQALADTGAAAYRLDLEAGDFLELVVDQQGVDVALTFEAPGGRRVEIDGLLGAAGPERLLWLAEVAGPHRLEIRGSTPPSGGTYRIRLEEPRPAGDRERLLAEAARAFYEAGERIPAGDFAEAASRYRRNLEQWADLGEKNWQAQVHYALGFVEYGAGGLDDASVHFREALRLAEDPGLLARCRYLVGRIDLDRLELAPARDHLAQALQAFGELGDRRAEATCAHDLALVHKYLREVSRALELYGRALSLWRELGERTNEARTLQNRGRAYAAQGKTERALEDLGAALALHEELGNPRDLGVTFTGLGQVYRDLGELDQALSQFERALEHRGSDRRGRAVTLVGIGEVYRLRHEPQRARELFEEALGVFREMGERRDEANVLRNLGLLDDAADPDQAVSLYGQALEHARAIQDRDLQAACLLGLARAERSRGELEVARDRIEEALAVIEQLRRQPPGDDLRSAYFATKQNYYDFYVELLMELEHRHPGSGFAARALTINERARARSQLESLTEGGGGPRAGDDPLIGRQDELRRRIESQQLQLTELLTRGGEPSRSDELKRQLRALIDELDDVRGRIRRSDPLRAQMTDPEPLSARDVQQQVLDEDTLLLEYQLAEDRSYLWAVTTDSLEVFELAAQKDVDELTNRAARLLRVSDRAEYLFDLEETLAALSDELLAPVAERLDKKRLLIVADGSLQYLPFASLPSPHAGEGEPSRPLMADHEIVSVPSASLLHALRQRARDRERPSKDVAVFADPVFHPGDHKRRDDNRVARTDSMPRAWQQLPERLDHTRLEAAAILGLAEGRQNLEALRFDAVKDKLTSEELRDYRFVHIATHGDLDAEFPELSALVFSLYDSQGEWQDGFLRIHEVYALDLLADLVVLSACQTALGRPVRGEGLVGWTQGFMYSGAQQVIVSLWAVDDEATAELMRQFYGNIFQQELPPAAALRKAQLAIRQQPQWRAPFFWAAFLLQGDFR